MKLLYLFIASFLTALITPAVKAQGTNVHHLLSPDGKTQLEIGLDDKKQLVYQLTFDGQKVTNWSALGLDVNGMNTGNNAQVLQKNSTEHREQIDWPLGESRTIANNYNELILHCKSGTINFDVKARLFNGSMALRYSVTRGKNDQSALKKEYTQFNLAGNYKIYQYHEESIFRPMPLDSLTGICDLPATLVSDKHLFLSIGEADNRNYTKCVLVKGLKPQSLALNFYIDTLYRSGKVSAINKDSVVHFTGSFVTPWRTISCSGSAVGLHDYSQLFIKLVDPLDQQVPSWIKPGKVMRLQLTTEAGIEGIDFAAKHNFKYVLFDAGWYGSEFRTTSDPTKPIDGFDIERITGYGKQKGIGVILYVNYVGLKQKLDQILPLYKQWGVSGLKFGFVDGGTQKGLIWLDSAMKKAYDNGFILNLHDHYKPTGLSRRYPSQLSQEGIRGDEHGPDALHNMTLPYTRFLAGAADFTFCYPNSKDSFGKSLKVSKGQQLALTVVYFSPMPSIFWYGKPKDYVNEKEIEFFDYVPTVWDETRYLAGEIGESISVARKKDNIWYVGNAAGLTGWRTAIKTDFLDSGKTYTATIYEDDGQKGIRIRTIKMNSQSSFDIDIDAKCGQAVIIRPNK